MGFMGMMVNNQMESGSVADSKLVKFETVVKEIKKYLTPRKTNVSIGSVFAEAGVLYFSMDGNRIFSPQCITKYTQNPYVKILDNILLHHHGIMSGLVQMGMDSNVVKEKDVVEMYRNGNQYKNKSHVIIFWMLFATTIDDEIYNNELSGIIDFAYCLDFNEAMIRDWCKAIEYVLAGNHLSEDCDLVCESDEGNRFFLHK